MTLLITARPRYTWFRSEGPAIPDMAIGRHVRLIAGANQECGCPEEEWQLENGAPLLIHFEADGTAEVVLSFFEDQDLGTTLHDIPDMAALREAAIDWAMRAIAGQAKGEWL